MKPPSWATTIAVSVALGVGFGGALVACDSEDRGFGDAPVGTSDDSSAEIINFPNTFMNVAFKCFGPNGIYAHTREAAPLVVPNDPQCAEGAR